MKIFGLIFMLQVLLCSYGAKHDARVLGAFDEQFAIRNVNRNEEQIPNTRSVIRKPSSTFNVVDTRTNQLEEAILPACPPSSPTASLPVSPLFPLVINNEWEAIWLFELRLSLMVASQEYRKHFIQKNRKDAL